MSSSFRWRRALAFGWLVIALASPGCGPRTLYPAVLLTPTVTIDDASSLLSGRPMTVRFSWAVDRLFVPPDGPYRVFVHYLDEDGALAFVDDHELPVDVRRLQPGARIDYDRRVILPDRAMRLSIRVGLFSARFPYKGTVLDGKTGNSDFPIVARFETRANAALAEEAVAGARGFDPWEIDGRTTARSSRWVARRGRFLFLQRAEGTTLLVQGFAMRSRLQKAPTLTLRVGGVETTRVLENDDRVVLQLDIPGDGRTRLVEGEIESDLTFNDRGREVSFCVERFRAIPPMDDRSSTKAPRP